MCHPNASWGAHMINHGCGAYSLCGNAAWSLDGPAIWSRARSVPWLLVGNAACLLAEYVAWALSWIAALGLNCTGECLLSGSTTRQ
jgi:hypothetical protein